MSAEISAAAAWKRAGTERIAVAGEQEGRDERDRAFENRRAEAPGEVGRRKETAASRSDNGRDEDGGMSGATESVTLYGEQIQALLDPDAFGNLHAAAFIAYVEIARLSVRPPGEVGVLHLPAADRELFARTLAARLRFPASKVSRAIDLLADNGFIESERDRLLIRDFDRMPPSAFLRPLSANARRQRRKRARRKGDSSSVGRSPSSASESGGASQFRVPQETSSSDASSRRGEEQAPSRAIPRRDSSGAAREADSVRMRWTPPR